MEIKLYVPGTVSNGETDDDQEKNSDGNDSETSRFAYDRYPGCDCVAPAVDFIFHSLKTNHVLQKR